MKRAKSQNLTILQRKLRRPRGEITKSTLQRLFTLQFSCKLMAKEDQNPPSTRTGSKLSVGIPRLSDSTLCESPKNINSNFCLRSETSKDRSKRWKLRRRPICSRCPTKLFSLSWPPDSFSCTVDLHISYLFQNQETLNPKIPPQMKSFDKSTPETAVLLFLLVNLMISGQRYFPLSLFSVHNISPHPFNSTEILQPQRLGFSSPLSLTECLISFPLYEVTIFHCPQLLHNIISECQRNEP